MSGALAPGDGSFWQLLLLGLPALVAGGVFVVGGEPWPTGQSACQQRKVKVVTRRRSRRC